MRTCTLIAISLLAGLMNSGCYIIHSVGGKNHWVRVTHCSDDYLQEKRMQLPLLLTVRCIAGLALLLACSVRDARGSCVRRYTSSVPDCETLKYGSCKIEIDDLLTGNIFSGEDLPNEKYF